MNQIVVEIGVILVLLLVNGVFAMTEIAIVAARKGRLRQLATAGNTRAQAALELAESPNRFLSTVQIGITLVGILAGAFGGATIAEELAKVMQGVPVLGPYSDAIGLGVVVLVITYFSLVLGELVPKRIGLGNPEGISMLVAKPMQALSVFAGPVVRFLSVSTDGLLRLAAIKPSKEAAVTDDEIKVLMQEGLRAGAFHKVESDIVESVLDLDQLTVHDIMTPRPKVIWLNRDDPHEAVWHKIVVSNHSYLPGLRAGSRPCRGRGVREGGLCEPRRRGRSQAGRPDGAAAAGARDAECPAVGRDLQEERQAFGAGGG